MKQKIIDLIKQKTKQIKKRISIKEADQLIKEHHKTHGHVKEDVPKKPKKTVKSSKQSKKIRKK